MSINHNLNNFIALLEENIEKELGDKSMNEKISFLQGWDRYQEVNELFKSNALCTGPQTKDKFQVIKTGSSEVEKEQLMAAMCNLKEKIQKSIHPNIK